MPLRFARIPLVSVLATTIACSAALAADTPSTNEYQVGWAPSLRAANEVIEKGALQGWSLKSISTAGCALMTNDKRLEARSCFLITFERARKT